VTDDNYDSCESHVVVYNVNKQTTRELGKGDNQEVVSRAWQELPRGDIL